MKRIIPVLIASMSMVAMAGSVSAKELKAVGLTVGDMANPFFVAMGKGTEEAAKKINPNVKVTALSTKYDLNTQVGQIENFIANKIDLLLVNAVDRRRSLQCSRRPVTPVSSSSPLTSVPKAPTTP